MNIKSIELQNFQSHHSTHIEPAPPGQLTVITGPSDSGKTAIIRALKWLLYNQPAGADFMRTGASMVRISVKFADGNIVTRERTAATNRYKILQPGAEKPEVFEGFGATVPLEIQEITGVRTVKIADLDLMLNLSEQLDGPFLGQKSISSPARAKILGKLAGTEEIDVAGASVGKDLYRRGQDEKRLAAEIEELAARIEEFAWIEELGERIAKLEQLLAGIKDAQARRSALEALKTRLAEIEKQETSIRAILKQWKELPRIEATVSRAEAALERLKRLKGLSERLNSIWLSIGYAEATLRRLQVLEDAGHIVTRTEKELARAKALHSIRVKLGQIDADLKLCRVELQKPRVVNLERLAAAVKKVEDAAERAGTLAIIKGRLAQIDDQEPRLLKTTVFYDQRIPELEAEYLRELKAAKICPTCGQSVAGLSEFALKEVV